MVGLPKDGTRHVESSPAPYTVLGRQSDED